MVSAAEHKLPVPEVTWRRRFAQPIAGEDDAAAFVAAMGFCTWAPLPRLPFPNLAEAMGESALSVMDRTWFWKDDLHLARRVYYGKIVDGRPSFIAPEFVPSFVAALGGLGHEAERDPDRLYFEGRLSREAHAIYAYLLDHPAVPTRDLRRGARLHEQRLAAATERGLVELQRRFLVCKAGLTGRTRGTYSYVWDLAERFWPEVFDEARRTTVVAARAHVRAQLRALELDLTPAQETKLFLWR
jgi:hypothetical protein